MQLEKKNAGMKLRDRGIAVSKGDREDERKDWQSKCQPWKVKRLSASEVGR